MAHHNHHSPPPPMVASSDQTLFLCLSISLPSLDQTPKVSTSLYTRFFPNPNPCFRSLSSGSKKYSTRCVSVWGFGFRWWVAIFSLFLLMGLIGYVGNGDEGVEDLREMHRASMEVEKVAGAQSGWENGALGRERETQLRWEREFYWRRIQVAEMKRKIERHGLPGWSYNVSN